MDFRTTGLLRLLGLGGKFDEELYKELVGSLYSTPKSIVAASAVAVATTGLAYHFRGDPVFLGLTLAFAAIGAARALAAFLFHSLRLQDTSAAELSRWELYALLGAWLFAGLTGLSAAYATLMHAGTEVELLTSCGAIGYIAGISSRNASRPLIAIGQISAICVPFLISLFYRADLVHLSIATFILVLFLSTIVMSRTMHENIVLRYRAHADLEKTALYDALTGVKNRTAFTQHINQDLSAKAAGGGVLALIAIDLDNFKDVNDGLGHPAGDAMLKEAARRISAAITLPHEVSRVGGDEFLVALRDVELKDAERVARQLCQALAGEFRYEGAIIHGSASVGLALGPRDGDTFHALMSSADLALYAAKAGGRGQVVVYSEKLRTAFDERRAFENDMRSVLSHSELELAFQPIIDERTGRAISCEALVRWHHPERGPVSPADFIPIAEQTGLIVPIGTWVLQTACAEAVSWPSDVTVAVNLSAVQFKREHDLLSVIRNALAVSGLPPRRLELEITESALIENADATRAIIDELRADGIGIALDDFGTGFSSLGYLKDFRFTKVKLDRKFCQAACEDARARSIIRSIRQLTTDIGVELVAEGIETADQLRSVSDLGLHAVQGYVFSRPLSAAHLRAVLDRPFPVRRARSVPKEQGKVAGSAA